MHPSLLSVRYVHVASYPGLLPQYLTLGGHVEEWHISGVREYATVTSTEHRATERSTSGGLGGIS